MLKCRLLYILLRFYEQNLTKTPQSRVLCGVLFFAGTILFTPYAAIVRLPGSAGQSRAEIIPFATV